MTSDTPRKASTETPSSSYVRVTSVASTVTVPPGSLAPKAPTLARSRDLLAGGDLVGAAHDDAVAGRHPGDDLHDVLPLDAHRHVDPLGAPVAYDPDRVAAVRREDRRRGH